MRETSCAAWTALWAICMGKEYAAADPQLIDFKAVAYWPAVTG